MTDDIEADLRTTRSIYESEVRAARVRRGRMIVRAHDAGLSYRRIAALTGYSIEHVSAMAQNAAALDDDSAEDPERQLAAV